MSVKRAGIEHVSIKEEKAMILCPHLLQALYHLHLKHFLAGR